MTVPTGSSPPPNVSGRDPPMNMAPLAEAQILAGGIDGDAVQPRGCFFPDELVCALVPHSP